MGNECDYKGATGRILVVTEIFCSLTCISVSISVVVLYEFHKMLPHHWGKSGEGT